MSKDQLRISDYLEHILAAMEPQMDADTHRENRKQYKNNKSKENMTL